MYDHTIKHANRNMEMNCHAIMLQSTTNRTLISCSAIHPVERIAKSVVHVTFEVY